MTMLRELAEWFGSHNPLLQALALLPLMLCYWGAAAAVAALPGAKAGVPNATVKAPPPVRFLRRWLLPPYGAAAARQFVMLSTSLLFLFYMTRSPAQIAGLLAIGTFSFGVACLIDRTKGPGKRGWLLVGLAITLGWLIGFKYLELISQGLNAALAGMGRGEISLPKLFVPLGISYYVFRMISYQVEVYWEEAPRVSLLEYLHYLAFFPTLVAGPIERIGPFHEQDQKAKFSAEDTEAGLRRMVLGIGKKVLLADLVGGLVLGWPIGHPDTPIWMGPVVFYMFWWRLYWDFSGYSDIAIGAARLFGYRIVENFDRPFLAVNIQDFWQRWHISLSFWIRDYLYYPLVTMRQGRKWGANWTYLALVVSMGLCGLWHGASVQFLYWGLYHGLGLAGLAAYQEFKRRRLASWTWLEAPAVRWLNVFLTFNFVTVGHWLFLQTGWLVPHAWMRGLLGWG